MKCEFKWACANLWTSVFTRLKAVLLLLSKNSDVSVYLCIMVKSVNVPANHSDTHAVDCTNHTLGLGHAHIKWAWFPFSLMWQLCTFWLSLKISELLICSTGQPDCKWLWRTHSLCLFLPLSHTRAHMHTHTHTRTHTHTHTHKHCFRIE